MRGQGDAWGGGMSKDKGKITENVKLSRVCALDAQTRVGDGGGEGRMQKR